MSFYYWTLLDLGGFDYSGREGSTGETAGAEEVAVNITTYK